MAINKKLIHFATKANFNVRLANSEIDSKSIVFIQDTGEIWTHGKIFNSATWGTNQTNYIPLTIGGTTYNLSKDGHTHAETVPTNKGGTGLTSIGTAGQVLQVNIGGTGLEWGTVSVSEESRDKGVNNVTTLASLPISKRLVYATVTAATSISLSSAMEIGDELHIVVYNSSTSAVTQVLPNTGAFVSMSNSYISIPASRYVEINIICHATGSYIIRAGGVSW